MPPTERTERAGEHPDDGVLVRYLDGELSEAAHERVLRHVRGCGPCTERLDRLRAVSDRLARELAHAGLPPSLKRAARRDTEPARRDREQPARRPGPRRARAATLAALLLAATVAVASAALPSVRGWIAERAAEVSALVTDRPAGPPAGVQTRAVAGLTVTVRGASPGTRVRVELVDGERAGAWSRGATFRTDGARLVVEPVGGEDVRVKLPRGARTAALEVNGRRWLTLREGTATAKVMPERRAGDTLVFRVPGPGSGR